jgi:hypothetical protein
MCCPDGACARHDRTVLQICRKAAAAAEEFHKQRATEWQLVLPRRPRGAARGALYPYTQLVRQRACAHCGGKGDFVLSAAPGALHNPDGSEVQKAGLLCLQCAPDTTVSASQECHQETVLCS